MDSELVCQYYCGDPWDTTLYSLYAEMDLQFRSRVHFHKLKAVAHKSISHNEPVCFFMSCSTFYILEVRVLIRKIV